MIGFRLDVFLKKHPVVDLSYKFLIWFLLSFGLQHILQNADASGGKYIASAINTNNQGKYLNILFVLSSIFLCLGMFPKNIVLKLEEESRYANFFVCLASFPQKLATDFIQASFTLTAGLLGFIIYNAIFIKYETEVLPGEVVMFSFGILVISIVSFVLGVAFCLLKAERGSKLLAPFIRMPLWAIFIAYPMGFWILVKVLWHFPS